MFWKCGPLPFRKTPLAPLLMAATDCVLGMTSGSPPRLLTEHPVVMMVVAVIPGERVTLVVAVLTVMS